jgi:hypothetical protein
MVFLLCDSNPEWLKGRVSPVSRLSYPCTEEKGQVMLGKCADLRSFTCLPLCWAGDKLQTFWLGVAGRYNAEVTNADSKVETVQASLLSTPRRENMWWQQPDVIGYV